MPSCDHLAVLAGLLPRMRSGILNLKMCFDECGAGHLQLAPPVASGRQGYGKAFSGEHRGLGRNA